MQVRLWVDGDERGVGSLLSWLREDPRTRALALELGSARPRSGAMGGAELILAVTQTVLAFGQLIMAAVAWRDARPSARTRLVVESEDGELSVAVEAASAEEIDRLFEMLAEAARGDKAPDAQSESNR